MTAHPTPLREADLQAYIDDRLEPAAREALARRLAEDPDLRSRVEAMRTQRLALRDLLDPIAHEPIPANLDIRTMAASRRRPRPIPAWAQMAAALLLVVGGASGGWAARGWATPPPNGVRALSREAADSFRVYAADPQRPVEVENQLQLASWVSSRVGATVKAPDLRAAGYSAIGGRLVATPHGPAGLFIFDKPGAPRLAVLVRPMKIQESSRMVEASDGALGRVSWASDGMGYSLVGPQPAGALHPIADQIRRQVDQPSAS